MFYNDHNPPHFHIIYQDFEALMNIETLEIIEGELPKRATSLSVEWAIEHRAELLENWKKARKRETLNKIEPLDYFNKLIFMISIDKYEFLHEKSIRFYFSEFISDDELSKPLNNQSYFSQAKLYNKGRGIYWPNGFDFCPDYLHEYKENKVTL